LQRIAIYGGGLVPVAGSYLAFRRLYFGDWVPNTYHAKDTPSLFFGFDPAKWTGLLEAAVGPLAIPASIAVAAGALWLFGRGKVDGRTASLAAHLVVAAAAYVLMPQDWMGEYRFATPFFIFFYWALAEALGRVAETARGLGVAAALGALIAATSATVHAPRTAAFARGPVVPLAGVARFYGDGYNRLAEVLGAPAPSLLAPDVGGTFLTSRLRVYDLVGLCDATAARTLRSDTAAFHRYVFEEARPTFIHVHGPWARWAAFHSNPRFTASYVALRESWLAPETRTGSDPERGSRQIDEPTWGDYVRRDAIGPDPRPTLRRLRAAYAEAGMAQASF
jgi:hypothetical protein